MLFSPQIPLARASSTILTGSGKRDILVLFQNLMESMQSFTIKYGGCFIGILRKIEEIHFYS